MEIIETKKLNLESMLLDSIVQHPDEALRYGMLNGNSGILMCLLYYAENNPNVPDDVQEKIEQLADDLLNGLSDASSGGNYSEGLSGMLWVLYHLKSMNYLEIEDELFTAYAESLNKLMVNLAKSKLFDNLHGAFGILNYLAQSKTLLTDSFDEFIATYKAAIYKDSSLTLLKETFSIHSAETAYNFSISHGLSGKIAILMQVNKQYPSVLLKNLIDELCNLLLSLSHFGNLGVENCFFPSLTSKIELAEYGNKRLAWCYGDLGTAMVLYNYAVYFKKDHLAETLLKVLTDLSHRRGLTENFVKDAPICHGTAGIAYIFSKLFHLTGADCFKTAADYWESETYNFYLREGELSELGLFNSETKKFILNNGFLEGLSGILLALNSKRRGYFSWDSALFLS